MKPRERIRNKSFDGSAAVCGQSKELLFCHIVNCHVALYYTHIDVDVAILSDSSRDAACIKNCTKGLRNQLVLILNISSFVKKKILSTDTCNPPLRHLTNFLAPTWAIRQTYRATVPHCPTNIYVYTCQEKV
jgi:hypothetical protein